jgi:hypothetical protein
MGVIQEPVLLKNTQKSLLNPRTSLLKSFLGLESVYCFVREMEWRALLSIRFLTQRGCGTLFIISAKVLNCLPRPNEYCFLFGGCFFFFFENYVHLYDITYVIIIPKPIQYSESECYNRVCNWLIDWKGCLVVQVFFFSLILFLSSRRR